MVWFNTFHFNKSQWSLQWFGIKSPYQREKSFHCLFLFKVAVPYYVIYKLLNICLSKNKNCLSNVFGDQWCKLKFNVISGTYEMLKQSSF